MSQPIRSISNIIILHEHDDTGMQTNLRLYANLWRNSNLDVCLDLCPLLAMASPSAYMSVSGAVDHFRQLQATLRYELPSKCLGEYIRFMKTLYYKQEGCLVFNRQEISRTYRVRQGIERVMKDYGISFTRVRIQNLPIQNDGFLHRTEGLLMIEDEE